MKRWLGLTLAVLVALTCLGCRKKALDAFDAERFSEPALWKEASELLAAEKWRKASSVLKLMLDQYPSGQYVREAHIAYADTLFQRASDANLIEAQAKYLSYASFYPEDPRTPYARYQVAMCNYERRGKATRDQTVTRDAISEFERVAQEHPTSEYTPLSRVKIRELRDELAEHEFLVGEFYKRRGFTESVVRRMKFLLDKYPDYSRKDQAYLLLCEILVKQESCAEAKIYLDKLVAEYPGSKLRKDADKLLEDARRCDDRNRDKESRAAAGGAAVADSGASADGDQP